jgi:hypothetical protein
MEKQKIWMWAGVAVVVIAGFGIDTWYARTSRDAGTGLPGGNGGQTGGQNGDEWPSEIEKGGEATAGHALYFVALDDNGDSGKAIGCGDSLVPVATTGVTLEETLKALFALKDQNYGASGLYNALYNSSLKADQIVTGPSPSVALSGTVSLGGTCDTPRFQEQIEATIHQFSGFETAVITLNGKSLTDALSQK